METTNISKSSTIWEINDGEAFDPIKSIHNGATTGMLMLWDVHEDSDDGTFPRVSDWTRLCNRISNSGVSEYLTWISNKKGNLVAKTYYGTIERTAKYSNEAVITLSKPIQVIFGEVNGEPIIKEVDKIHGEFHCDWYWRQNGRQDKYANGLEIFFNCKKFELTSELS
jgi:hypothetical protein